MKMGGEMEDCTNVIINEMDILQKRRGFVRGLDERFSGVVCGLFTYMDDCGTEWLLVADEDQINIRQPFTLPSLQTLDCYPTDGFEEGSALDPDTWRNTSRYQITDGQLRLSSAQEETSLAQGVTNATRWFKEACSRSYQVTVQFNLASSGDQRVLVIIRGNGDLSSGPLLLASLEYISSSYVLRLMYRDELLVLNELARSTFTAATTGFMSLRYNATTRVPSINTTISSGGTQTLTADALSSVQDVEFGLISAIGLGQLGSTFPSDLGLLQVSGSSF